MRFHLPPKLPWLALMLSSIMLAASFVRLYNLSGTLQFQADQGRDALVVAKVFTERDLIFIGPVMSIGNIYLGPLYYYFMLPWLWLSYPSPMGPAYGVALLGIITVGLMYYLGQKMIGRRAALIAAALYSVSAVVVQYSRFSWNPNPAPFVTTIMIWACYQAYTKSAWYWVVVAGMAAILIQLHYLALLGVGAAGLIWLVQIWSHRRSPSTSVLRTQLLATVVGALIVIASLSPLILFDIKHQGLNVQAFTKLFTEEQSFKVTNHIPWTERVADTVKETHGRSLHILFDIPLGQNRTRNTIFLVVLATNLFWLVRQRPTSSSQAHHHQLGLKIILTFVLVGIAGTAIYDHSIFDHYLAFLFPVTFWLYGAWLASWSRTRWGQMAAAGFIGLYLIYNLPRLPLKSVGWNITDMNRVAEQVVSHLQPGETYGLVLLSESKDLYGQNYRYFLSTTDQPPLSPEKNNEADALVIINEEKAVTDPADIISLPIWEISTFPHTQQPEVYLGNSDPDIVIMRR